MADDLARFKNPTIGEVIDELSKYPRDAKIAIKDADTDWFMRKFSLKYDEDESIYLFRARYYEQEKQ